ncbi:DNA-3-methyladenine glycosylase I [Aquirufa nivalisilvae]|uniref:DNA-3-methyladenine glycosylase I n=1 Tax=Aquirufa nivalisilvae TaxID=2516557 RepID=UPI0010329BAB|nr:DNA-3-methyladenine glycosylase I [Aquirufa nivalisilvae]TBH70980.1 DNA-3-methyladenine glycosylase I [Aquirufa nivalisilvae]
MTNQTRCAWVSSDPLYIAYHDTEWGKPLHDEKKLFELLILEGFQSGLSWITILRKREDFREAFNQFDYQEIAQWKDEKLEECLKNPKIIRNRLKINAVKMNAQAFIKIQEKFGSFDRYIWEFVGFSPIQNHFFSHQELPSSTVLSLAMSKSLKKHGFKFVGPTICYSFMQAAGLVNDHITECFCYQKN